ncbi:hypothetical protein BDN70DRAFT_995479 [Pholiota conissans]|uniref:Uncharacterized protein n=1 Tax=Pholiota conissans TaxID=109636 RepID=A0A9P6CR69_9AGAR|nr:hypothetical protein BDN70DRAFT_995479 [Pholiota conissans]
MEAVHRPRSIRSVASNSSLASAGGLSRRPRTRARSRTVTGSPKPGDAPPPPPSPLPSDLPYLAGPLVQEPDPIPDASTPDALSEPPVRPPRSPQRAESAAGAGEIRSTDTGSSQDTSTADPTFVEPTQSTVLSGRLSKAAKQASSLPHLDTGYRPPPSAFSRDPALTPVVNVRDSVSTQQSGVSSSLYPPSTSTASAPDSPTYPQSMATDHEIPEFALEVNEVQEYDSDDVSYRLRLLVKNNYFLPPAHSKPSAADFAPPVDPQKKSAPGFLDIFRVGKSKSKPTTPTGTGPGVNSLAPMLRTTADSIAVPYTTRQQQPRPPGQMIHAPPPSPAPPSRGRVVVVREKMADIAVAAKQAEQDLKTRGVRIDQGSQKTAPAGADDFIDPTDAVDIPPPSPSYPFAVQTSALHGLGVLESLGADILADHLPPSENPNLSISYDPIEDSWRKAILKQAVHHSLDNTPEHSTLSHPMSPTSPARARSKTVDSSRMPSPNMNMAAQKMINQKIIAPSAMDDMVKSAAPKHARQKSAHSQASAKGKAKLVVPITPDTSGDSRPASYQRVDTPLGPMTPLGPPPPRRPFLNTVHSASQVQLAHSTSMNALPADDSHRTVRRTVSSPSLAEGYDSHNSRHFTMTPPPLPAYPRDSQSTFTSFGTLRNYDADEISLQSENEGGSRAPSFRSAVLSRPSLSEYSQASQSPTTSVFQEMLNRESHQSRSSSASAGPSRFSIEQRRAMFGGSASSRAMAMSPPPRQSSSLAHVALPPPPRSSSFNYHGSAMMPSTSRAYHSPQPDLAVEEPGIEILAPEPSSPPLPSSGLQDEPLPMHSSSLYSSTDSRMQMGIRSAPGPSSPTNFFDSIQAQPNAMDDLESSSDESDTEEPHPLPPIQPPKIFADPRSRAISSASETGPRPVIMRHGNFSTPYVRGGFGESTTGPQRQNTAPLGNVANSKQSVVNVPARPTKTDIIASSDFFKYAQANPPPILASASAGPFGSSSGSKDSMMMNASAKRPSTADQEITSWRNNQRAQESLRKLDGMLIQHMEDEKDTIKRIATTLKQTKLTIDAMQQQRQQQQHLQQNAQQQSQHQPQPSQPSPHPSPPDHR